MLRLEIANFQFNRHQAGQRAVVEQKVNIEILSAHLDAVFLADEGEVLAKFQNELLQVVRDRFAEIALRKLLRKIEELQHIGVKNAAAHILGNGFGHQLLGGQHIAFIVGAVDLALQLALGIVLFRAQSHIKMSLFRRLCAGQDQQVVCPADLCHQWCHKFVVLVGLVKLLHTVQPTAVEAFDAGIGRCDIRCHFVDDLVTETGVGAQTGKVFPPHSNTSGSARH